MQLQGYKTSLLRDIASLINLLVEGKCHPDVIPILFGGNLTALVQKSGGIYPIAIGYAWRRLAAKYANSCLMSRLGDYSASIQLGLGVSEGCETAVLATRRFMGSIPNDFAFAKLYFANGFNNLRRDAMLEAVYK